MNNRCLWFFNMVIIFASCGCSSMTAEKLFKSDSYIRGEQARLTFYYPIEEGQVTEETASNMYNRIFYKFPIDSQRHKIGVKGSWVVSGVTDLELEGSGFNATDTDGKFIREQQEGYGAVVEEYDGFYYITIYTKNVRADVHTSVILDGFELIFPPTVDLVRQQLGEPSYRTEHAQKPL